MLFQEAKTSQRNKQQKSGLVMTKVGFLSRSRFTLGSIPWVCYLTLSLLEGARVKIS